MKKVFIVLAMLVSSCAYLDPSIKAEQLKKEKVEKEKIEQQRIKEINEQNKINATQRDNEMIEKSLSGSLEKGYNETIFCQYTVDVISKTSINLIHQMRSQRIYEQTGGTTDMRKFLPTDVKKSFTYKVLKITDKQYEKLQDRLINYMSNYRGYIDNFPTAFGMEFTSYCLANPSKYIINYDTIFKK